MTDPRPQLTLEDLVRWEENGAGWRPLELDDRHAVIELCTCTGEPVDVLAASRPDVLEYVRRHRPHRD